MSNTDKYKKVFAKYSKQVFDKFNKDKKSSPVERSRSLLSSIVLEILKPGLMDMAKEDRPSNIISYRNQYMKEVVIPAINNIIHTPIICYYSCVEDFVDNLNMLLQKAQLLPIDVEDLNIDSSVTALVGNEDSDYLKNNSAYLNSLSKQDSEDDILGMLGVAVFKPMQYFKPVTYTRVKRLYDMSSLGTYCLILTILEDAKSNQKIDTHIVSHISILLDSTLGKIKGFEYDEIKDMLNSLKETIEYITSGAASFNMESTTKELDETISKFLDLISPIFIQLEMKSMSSDRFYVFSFPAKLISELVPYLKCEAYAVNIVALLASVGYPFPLIMSFLPIEKELILADYKNVDSKILLSSISNEDDNEEISFGEGDSESSQPNTSMPTIAKTGGIGKIGAKTTQKVSIGIKPPSAPASSTSTVKGFGTSSTSSVKGFNTQSPTDTRDTEGDSANRNTLKPLSQGVMKPLGKGGLKGFNKNKP